MAQILPSWHTIRSFMGQTLSGAWSAMKTAADTTWRTIQDTYRISYNEGTAYTIGTDDKYHLDPNQERSWYIRLIFTFLPFPLTPGFIGWVRGFFLSPLIHYSGASISSWFKSVSNLGLFNDEKYARDDSENSWYNVYSWPGVAMGILSGGINAILHTAASFIKNTLIGTWNTAAVMQNLVLFNFGKTQDDKQDEGEDEDGEDLDSISKITAGETGVIPVKQERTGGRKAIGFLGYPLGLALGLPLMPITLLIRVIIASVHSFGFAFSDAAHLMQADLKIKKPKIKETEPAREETLAPSAPPAKLSLETSDLPPNEGKVLPEPSAPFPPPTPRGLSAGSTASFPGSRGQAAGRREEEEEVPLIENHTSAPSPIEDADKRDEGYFTPLEDNQRLIIQKVLGTPGYLLGYISGAAIGWPIMLILRAVTNSFKMAVSVTTYSYANSLSQEKSVDWKDHDIQRNNRTLPQRLFSLPGLVIGGLLGGTLYFVTNTLVSVSNMFSVMRGLALLNMGKTPEDQKKGNLTTATDTFFGKNDRTIQQERTALQRIVGILGYPIGLAIGSCFAVPAVIFRGIIASTHSFFIALSNTTHFLQSDLALEKQKPNSPNKEVYFTPLANNRLNIQKFYGSPGYVLGVIVGVTVGWPLMAALRTLDESLTMISHRVSDAAKEAYTYGETDDDDDSIRTWGQWIFSIPGIFIGAAAAIATYIGVNISINFWNSLAKTTNLVLLNFGKTKQDKQDKSTDTFLEVVAGEAGMLPVHPQRTFLQQFFGFPGYIAGFVVGGFVAAPIALVVRSVIASVDSFGYAFSDAADVIQADLSGSNDSHKREEAYFTPSQDNERLIIQKVLGTPGYVLGYLGGVAIGWPGMLFIRFFNESFKMAQGLTTYFYANALSQEPSIAWKDHDLQRNNRTLLQRFFSLPGVFIGGLLGGATYIITNTIVSASNMTRMMTHLTLLNVGKRAGDKENGKLATATDTFLGKNDAKIKQTRTFRQRIAGVLGYPIGLAIGSLFAIPAVVIRGIIASSHSFFIALSDTTHLMQSDLTVIKKPQTATTDTNPPPSAPPIQEEKDSNVIPSNKETDPLLMEQHNPAVQSQSPHEAVYFTPLENNRLIIQKVLGSPGYLLGTIVGAAVGWPLMWVIRTVDESIKTAASLISYSAKNAYSHKKVLWADHDFQPKDTQRTARQGFFSIPGIIIGGIVGTLTYIGVNTAISFWNTAALMTNLTLINNLKEGEKIINGSKNGAISIYVRKRSTLQRIAGSLGYIPFGLAAGLTVGVICLTGRVIYHSAISFKHGAGSLINLGIEHPYCDKTNLYTDERQRPGKVAGFFGYIAAGLVVGLPSLTIYVTKKALKVAATALYMSLGMVFSPATVAAKEYRRNYHPRFPTEKNSKNKSHKPVPPLMVETTEERGPSHDSNSTAGSEIKYGEGLQSHNKKASYKHGLQRFKNLSSSLNTMGNFPEGQPIKTNTYPGKVADGRTGSAYFMGRHRRYAMQVGTWGQETLTEFILHRLLEAYMACEGDMEQLRKCWQNDESPEEETIYLATVKRFGYVSTQPKIWDMGITKEEKGDINTLIEKIGNFILTYVGDIEHRTLEASPIFPAFYTNAQHSLYELASGNRTATAERVTADYADATAIVKYSGRYSSQSFDSKGSNDPYATAVSTRNLERSHFSV